MRSTAAKKSIDDAGLTKNADISFLITHQPTLGLMAKWRVTDGIDAPRVFDTFQKIGNLFQSSIPVTISEDLKTGVMKRGDILAIGTFSNGGDFVSSMVVKL